MTWGRIRTDTVGGSVPLMSKTETTNGPLVQKWSRNGNSVKALAFKYGVPMTAVRDRIKRGWSHDRAVSTPVRQLLPADPVKRRDKTRRKKARHLGIAAPPAERDCPIRPDTCDCCGRKPKVPLYLDHCHITGKFQGWCCPRCNGLGDDPTILKLRLRFLEKVAQNTALYQSQVGK